MDITVTRFVLFENEGTLKAFCDVALDDLVLIKGIRVIEGRDGPFMSMPRQQGRNGKWYDNVVPLSREIRKQLQQVVLETYRKSSISGVWPAGALDTIRDL
jgi:stage V sporulation protein G